MDLKIISKSIDRIKISSDLTLNYGEVTTPYDLRKDMLDLIPETYWDTPKTVLEPCCGKGGFLIDIIRRFKKGGHSYKNIVENFLWFYDLNPDNVKFCKKLLDPESKYKLNFHIGSFLDTSKKFDLVVGNPPYNKRGTRAMGGSIWELFVKKAVAITNKYLLFVHPCSWRKPPYKTSKFKGLFGLLAHDNHLISLKMAPEVEGSKIFGKKTNFDYYLMGKGTKKIKTKILDFRGKKYNIDLQKWDWLPNYKFNLIRKITNNKKKIEFFRSPKLRHGNTSRTLADGFKYPAVFSTNKTETKLYYSKNKFKEAGFGIPKVIIGCSGRNHTVIDMDGIYGIGEHAVAFPVSSKDEALVLDKALTSAKFKDIWGAFNYSSFVVYWPCLALLNHDFTQCFLNPTG